MEIRRVFGSGANRFVVMDFGVDPSEYRLRKIGVLGDALGDLSVQERLKVGYLWHCRSLSIGLSRRADMEVSLRVHSTPAPDLDAWSPDLLATHASMCGLSLWSQRLALVRGDEMQVVDVGYTDARLGIVLYERTRVEVDVWPGSVITPVPYVAGVRIEGPDYGAWWDGLVAEGWL